jgi:hypothetical protein
MTTMVIQDLIVFWCGGEAAGRLLLLLLDRRAEDAALLRSGFPTQMQRAPAEKLRIGRQAI